jgi:hypothetical protein
MTISLIGLDADDTLWHSEDGFHTVTGRFCELLQPYAQDPANLATTLDMVERRNMALFGYGVKSFTLSMVEAAIEVSGGAVPAETIQQLVDEGRTLLARPVDLLEGWRWRWPRSPATTAWSSSPRATCSTRSRSSTPAGCRPRRGDRRRQREGRVLTAGWSSATASSPVAFMVGNSTVDILPVPSSAAAVHIPYETSSGATR